MRWYFWQNDAKSEKEQNELGGHDSDDQMCDSSESFFSANT